MEQLVQNDSAPSLSLSKVVVYSGDVVAGGAILGSLLQYLPALAALVGLLFYSIQIWESKTIQAALARLSTRRKARKITRLNAKVTRAHRAFERAQTRLSKLTNGDSSAHTQDKSASSS